MAGDEGRGGGTRGEGRGRRESLAALLESRGGGESVVPLGEGGTRGGRRGGGGQGVGFCGGETWRVVK